MNDTPTPTPTPPTTTNPTIKYDDFAKIDLRVATITAAEHHPNADRLLKLQLDVGPLGPRQICAGVRAYYDPQSLVGKQIIIVANLAPRKIRGEQSNGMLLAASALGIANTDTPPDNPTDATTDSNTPDADQNLESVVDVVLLAPGKIVPPGSTVG